jgi:hypothetical protein
MLSPNSATSECRSEYLNRTGPDSSSKLGTAGLVDPFLRHLRVQFSALSQRAQAPIEFGQGYISDLESGRRKGTTAALKKIANTLNVPLDLLV